MKNKTSIILICCVSLILASCNQWLDVKPQNGIIRDNYWKTKEQLTGAVYGCYSSLLDNDVVSKLFAWGELRAGMVTGTIQTSDDAENIMLDNILATNKYTDWASIYRAINYCNTVIEFGPDVINEDNTLTQEELNSQLAEVRGLRALLYFYLVRTFRDVPLQLDAVSSDNKIEQLEASPAAEVLGQIREDLDFAEKYAKETYGDIDLNKGRITKFAVYAIQADVSLWMGDYEGAITACDAIIQSQRFGLIDGTSQSDWFNTLFFKGNSVESIFEFQFDQQKLNPFYNMLISSNREFIAAPTVMEAFYGIDQTGLGKDIRGDGGALNATDGTLWKFCGATSGDDLTLRTSDQSYAHWFVYRFADVLLMKAEALALTNQGQEALDLIATIRKRGQAIMETEMSPDPSATDDILDYILAERGRELAFEGKRWFDLLRFAKRDNYAGLPKLLQVVTENAPAYLKQSVRNKFQDTDSHYLPYNQRELQTDKALVQNPFYK